MNSKKRFAILLLFLVLWSFIIPTINSTYAKTNSNYATGENNFTIDEGNADDKLSKNTFLAIYPCPVFCDLPAPMPPRIDVTTREAE